MFKSLKKFKVMSLVLVSMVFLASCGNTAVQEVAQEEVVETAPDSEAATEQAEITILNEEEELAKKTLTFNPGDKLGDVMEDQLEIVSTEDGFIESINGVSQVPEENKWWTYTVNGEMIMEGAYDYELQPGDQVVFTLSVYEG